MRRKGLAVGIILLFVGAGIIPIEGSLSIEKEQSVMSKSSFDGIILNGTMGENGWYVNPVWVTLDFPGNHSFYQIDQGGWNEFTTPFVVTSDGLHNVSAYYIDNEGHQSDTYYATFKIDQTSPDFIDFTSEEIGHDKYRIQVNASDDVSGMNRVDLYINRYLMCTDYEAPYEWIYQGPPIDLDCIAYDNAGNSVMPGIFHPRRNFLAIGCITNPQFSESGGTFYAKFVIVIEYRFLHHHIYTLTNQSFAFYNYKGLITENFVMVKYTTGDI
jgi:hypothetical protein